MSVSEIDEGREEEVNFTSLCVCEQESGCASKFERNSEC